MTIRQPGQGETTPLETAAGAKLDLRIGDLKSFEGPPPGGDPAAVVAHVASSLPAASPSALLQSAAAHAPGVAREVSEAIGAARQVARSVQAASSLARGLISSVGGGAAPMLPEVKFGFQAAGASGWRVERFDAVEALSELYEARVILAHDDPGADPDELLGQPACLKLDRGAQTRRIAGVVRRVEHLGVVAGHRVARVYLVPELWGLSQRFDSRVFQNLTAIDVVQEVFTAAGVYTGRLQKRLGAPRLTREYCVQHQESDLDFVLRLLEDEGVTFHFEHADAGETIVLTDHAGAWRDVETLDGGEVPIAGTGASLLHTESVRHFDHAEELRPTSATVRDFDFTRPRLDLTQSASSDDNDARPVYHHVNPLVLADYAGGQYRRDNRSDQARFRDQRHASERRRAAGKSGVTGFAPGHTFALEGHGVEARNARHVLTRVTHRGRAREENLQETQHDDASDDRYHNEFECTPADVVHRPARVTRRPVIAGYQTATVVGPEGEEIYVDEHGRIKVQFHWDRAGERDENSSCWIRVMQSWSGGGWGFVFTPRIGMEVVVQFADGDPDRPLVTGCVYNGENHPPYPLPAEKTKSTLRTRSSPRSDGFNELRFEDLAGREQIYMHAQRNHDVEVLKNQSITVGGNRTKGVKGCEFNTVQRDRTTTVTGSNELKVIQGYTITVKGEAGMGTDVTHACTVTSKQRIQLAVGGNSITITNKGIWIKGTIVKINCAGEPEE